MGRKNFTLDLAKLIISAAWADGECSTEEVNALKDLLFNLGEVSAEDWSVLSMYIESPAGEAEKEELLGRVMDGIRTGADKELALQVLDELFQSDGNVTAEEQELMEQLRKEISEVRTGVFGGISRAVKSAMGRREAVVRNSCLREQEVDDYVRNTVYYDLIRRQKDASVTIELPEADVRKLCLAAGLLAHVANVDAVISPEERTAMRKIIAEDWGLPDEQAELFVAISCNRTTKGLDYVRLCQSYFECTDIDERRNFLKTLFRVANAANKTDYAEIQEIDKIADSLKLSHKDYINAKVTIPRADRKGL